MLFVWPSALLARFVGMHGCHWPCCWTSGIQYLPHSSRLPIITGCPFTVIRTSSSLCIVTPCFMNMDTLPSLFTLPMLNTEVGKSSNVWASTTAFDSCGIGRGVTFVTVLNPQLATLTCLVNFCMIGNFAIALSVSLM